jgi:hypothetical protein
MLKSHRKAGENIRKLAAKRKFKAAIAFTSAIFSVGGSIYLNNAFKDLANQLLTISSTSSNTNPPDFSYVFYGVGLMLALGFVSQGLFLWKRAQQAEQGAQGEEAIAQILLPLTQEGWQFEYGLMLGKGLGDADIIGLSPKGKGFVIDVKSHGGEVKVEGDRLFRRYGRKTYPFEKDFLASSMKQAYQVKELKKLAFVTPIVAFSRANVNVSTDKVKGVYVVGRSQLIPLLKKLG